MNEAENTKNKPLDPPLIEALKCAIESAGGSNAVIDTDFLFALAEKTGHSQFSILHRIEYFRAEGVIAAEKQQEGKPFRVHAFVDLNAEAERLGVTIYFNERPRRSTQQP